MDEPPTTTDCTLPSGGAGPLDSVDERVRSADERVRSADERVRVAEERLRRAERFERFGALAGGLAHDLNNALAPILMSVGLLRSMVADPEALAVLESLESGAARGAELVRKLLTLARDVEPPRAGAEARSAGPRGERAGAAPRPRGAGELILVVDDDEPIRVVARRVLEASGYRVIVASDGAEGLATYTARRGEVALVLTDMMMPVMDGPALVRAIRRLDPGARIVAASGVSSDSAMASIREQGVRRILAKPYGADTLLGAIREALEGPAGVGAAPGSGAP